MYTVWGHEHQDFKVDFETFTTLAAAKRYAVDTCRMYPDYSCVTVTHKGRTVYEIAPEDVRGN